MQRGRPGTTHGETNAPRDSGQHMASRHKYWHCIAVCANADRATHNNHGELRDKKLTGTHGTSALAGNPSLRRSSSPAESTCLEGWTYALSIPTEDSTRKQHQRYRNHEAAMPVLASRISMRDSGLSHSAGNQKLKLTRTCFKLPRQSHDHELQELDGR